VVREGVLEGVAELLTAGDDLTFAKVARAAGVPERTVYRHFPTKEALLTAVFHWANEHIGFAGDLPTDGAAVVALVREVFPGFDEIAPVVRELLLAPEGRVARLRGHLDRLALTAASAEAFADLRQRLIERGVHPGEVEDRGAFHALWFDDPDGMRVELIVTVDPELRGIHEPRPLAAAP
jgi:AcrR family transcriptional regulator